MESVGISYFSPRFLPWPLLCLAVLVRKSLIVECSACLLCWVDQADANTHLKGQCLNVNDNGAQAGCHPGAAMVPLILGIKVKGRESFLEVVVLELNNNHSFSFLPLQTPKKRPGTCIALVLIFRDANSSGSQMISVVFAWSPLLPLLPCPSWTQLCCDSVYFVENSVPWGKYDNAVFRQLCLGMRWTEPAGWHHWSPRTCQPMESSCLGWNSYHSYDFASYIISFWVLLNAHTKKRKPWERLWYV